MRLPFTPLLILLPEFTVSRQNWLMKAKNISGKKRDILQICFSLMKCWHPSVKLTLRKEGTFAMYNRNFITNNLVNVTIIPRRLTTMGEWVQVGWGKGAPESAQNMGKGVDHVPRIGWGDVLEEWIVAITVGHPLGQWEDLAVGEEVPRIIGTLSTKNVECRRRW